MILYRGRNIGMFMTDAEFEEGQWYLVLEWSTNHDGEFPSLRLPIAAERLTPFVDGEVVIERAVEIPESDTTTAAFRAAGVPLE